MESFHRQGANIADDTRQPGRGFGWRKLRAITAGLVALSIVLSPLRVLAAPTADELGKIVSVDQARQVLGITSDSVSCSPIPADVRTVDQSNAANVGVEIQGVRFMLDHAFKINRQQGRDSYDFIFTPVSGDQRVRPLEFIYRSNPGRDSSNGLVVGKTNDGFTVEDRKVTGCSDFGGSALAKALDANANDGGVQALNVTHSGDTGETTGFLDAQSGNTDPFTQAVLKIAEVVSSLNTSLVSAIKSTLDMNNLTDVAGLTDAWKVVRDLVNVLFMIVLVALAILTIVRLDMRNYNVRQILPLLVFAIITVNFGLLFARIMLNTAFVLSQPLLTSAKSIVDVAAVTDPTNGVSGVGFGTAVVLLFAALIMLVGLAVLLFFFIIRIIVVWILAALSPIVFLFMVLPLTRGEANKLLVHWIRWVYMAPIAFLILYIGAAMLVPMLAHTQANDSGATAILRAIFYAGILAAAVLIPYGLGGSIMRHASRAGMGGGLKGGGALASVIPAGGGKTLAHRVREGRAFLKQRTDSQEQDAQLAAANTRINMAERLNQFGPVAQGVGRTVTGMSPGQQVAGLEEMVGRAQKEMIPMSLAAKMRIANAHKYGTRRIGGQVYANTEGGGYIASGPMDAKEVALAQNRVNAAAAFRELAQAEFADEHLLKGGRNYAWTGYQQLHKTDPVVSSYERGGDRINMQSLRVKSQLMRPDDVRGLDGNVIAGVESGRHEYLEVMRNIDAIRLGDAVDPNARNKFHSQDKARRVYELAKKRQLSRTLRQADFPDHAAYSQAVTAQREKEDLIIRRFEGGHRKYDTQYS